MKHASRHTRAELHILDRMLYMLEEKSVGHIAANDESFADFVGQLYGTIDGQAKQLRQLS